jgi:gamma-glutamylcyclotransferase (GGCT)/AIG2-like uncharacterized protein YtfP
LPALKKLGLRLFVYGSLKRGGLHHAELKGAPFLGEAETAPGFGLETLGSYLALIPAPGTDQRVRGELFDVPSDLLPHLDEFEGDAYERRELEIFGRSGRVGVALAYFRKSR